MLTDDVINVSLAIISMGFGKYYRTVKSVDRRQLLGTVWGFAIVAIICKSRIGHPLVVAVVNAIIISKLSPK